MFAHLFIRARLPDADPYLFPLAALLAAFGLVMIYRIDAELAREQAQWFVIGLVAVLRDGHLPARPPRRSSATATRSRRWGSRCWCCRGCPGIGAQVNGAFLAVKVGPIQFQPAEFAKIAIIVFLASYLRDTGDVLVRARLRPLPFQNQVLLFGGAGRARAAGGARARPRHRGDGAAGGLHAPRWSAIMRERPSLKHFGPLLLVWGVAMLMLLFIRDLGSSLMFFGGFLALLYVATARLSLVGVGRHDVPRRRHLLREHREPRAGADRHLAATRSTATLRATRSTAATRSPSPSSRRPTADCSGRGSARRCSSCRAGRRILPAAHTDLIYAVITDELGLFGAAGLILVYLLFAARGFKTALVAGDGFSKLLAAGPHGGVRAAGVRDRRRRDQGDPAHRRDAAVRLLRRQLDRGQHGAAGAAADRVRPRAQGPRRAEQGGLV